MTEPTNEAEASRKRMGRAPLWPDEEVRKFYFKGPASLRQKIEDVVRDLKAKGIPGVSKSSVQRIVIENNLTKAEELFLRSK